MNVMELAKSLVLLSLATFFQLIGTSVQKWGEYNIGMGLKLEFGLFDYPSGTTDEQKQLLDTGAAFAVLGMFRYLFKQFFVCFFQEKK